VRQGVGAIVGWKGSVQVGQEQQQQLLAGVGCIFRIGVEQGVEMYARTEKHASLIAAGVRACQATAACLAGKEQHTDCHMDRALGVSCRWVYLVQGCAYIHSFHRSIIMSWSVKFPYCV
jgi:hypothetical protein